MPIAAARRRRTALSGRIVIRLLRRRVSSAVVIAPSPPPVPRVDRVLALGDRPVDLATRALVAGVVAAPRFGRESEVVATAAAVAAGGADLVDVSLPPRLAGPVARAGRLPVVARIASTDDALAAARAGAVLVLVPGDRPGVLAALAGDPDLGAALGLLAADAGDLAAARALADEHAAVLALDVTPWSGAEAMAREAVAIAEGCRLLRTRDVRRSRRVAEVMAAILAARRPSPEPGGRDDGGRR